MTDPMALPYLSSLSLSALRFQRIASREPGEGRRGALPVARRKQVEQQAAQHREPQLRLDLGLLWRELVARAQDLATGLDPAADRLGEEAAEAPSVAQGREVALRASLSSERQKATGVIRRDNAEGSRFALEHRTSPMDRARHREIAPA